MVVVVVVVRGSTDCDDGACDCLDGNDCQFCGD